MEPVIIEKSPMTLLGFSFFGNPFKFSPDWTEENEIGRLWQRFIGYYTQHNARIKHVKMDAVITPGSRSPKSVSRMNMSSNATMRKRRAWRLTIRCNRRYGW